MDKKVCLVTVKNGYITYKKVDEDYYSLNLNVSGQLNLYGFEWKHKYIMSMFDDPKGHEFLMDFNFDFNRIDLSDKNKQFIEAIGVIKQIKSIIRNQQIDKVINDN